MIYKTTLTVRDDKGFHYEVMTEHHPLTGISIAYFKGERIARREIGRAQRPPQSDNDQEWEAYEEYIAEWCDEANSDLLLACKEYVNHLLSDFLLPSRI